MLLGGCASCLSGLGLFRSLNLDLLCNVCLTTVCISDGLNLCRISHLGHSEVECDQVCTREHVVKVELILYVECDWMRSALRAGPERVASRVFVVVREDRLEIADVVVIIVIE